MPVTEQYVYLDHAAISPLPRPTRDAMAFWADDAMLGGVAHWKHWQNRIEVTRELAADLIGAKPTEVAFTSSTSAGVTAVAEGLDWKAGDSIVVPANEFPSNMLPWTGLKQQGVEVRVTGQPSECESADEQYRQLAEACDSTTRLIACSWIDYCSGRRLDVDRLSQIARQNDALLLVDAIQGLGVFPLNAETSGIDFLVADGRKWLLGPDAAAVLYIRQSRLDLLRVAGQSWNSVVNSLNFDTQAPTLKPSASRFETAITNAAGINGLHASLTLMKNVPLDVRQREMLRIRDMFVEAGLRCGLHAEDRPRSDQSGIISFGVKDTDPRLLCRSLRHSGILASVRGGRLRVSPHLYNNQEDAERFATAVASAGN